MIASSCGNTGLNWERVHNGLVAFLYPKTYIPWDFSKMFVDLSPNESRRYIKHIE